MRIIATDIANLTDARYFAAWGVEGMAYTIDAQSLTNQQLKEIVDWVEGPTTILKIDGLEIPEQFTEAQRLLDIQHVIIGPFIDQAQMPPLAKVYRICTLEDGWQDGTNLILSFPYDISSITDSQKVKLEEITSGREVFLDANFSASDLKRIEELGFAGIILKGGEEEKVGFKSYDELDEILEVLFD